MTMSSPAICETTSNAKHDPPKPCAKRTLTAEGTLAERHQLLIAAQQVLDRSGWWGFKVESVLKQAHLSTRSFYRHFEKKTDLLLALLEKELGGAARHLQRVTAAADDPSERVLAYIAATIDMAYNEELARPSSLFASHWRELLTDYSAQIDRTVDAMIAPLAEAIQDGCDRGAFSTPDPVTDARAIFQLVSSITADLVTAGSVMPRTDVEHIVLPFISRAIGMRLHPSE